MIILDDLSSGSKENVPTRRRARGARHPQPGGRRSLIVDRGVEVLIHHAAQMDVRRSVKDPAFDADVNLLGLINLLEAARRGVVRQVVFASTGGAIYGEQDVHPADETHPVRPVSPYGVAKLASERYLYFYHHEYGIDATCLRYANVYGPRQNPHGEAGVVAIFLHRLLADEQPVINGDGSRPATTSTSDDVVRANLAAVGRDGFRIYNVGTGVETDVNTLFGYIHAPSGAAPRRPTGPALRASSSVPRSRPPCSSASSAYPCRPLSATAFSAPPTGSATGRRGGRPAVG